MVCVQTWWGRKIGYNDTLLTCTVGFPMRRGMFGSFALEEWVKYQSLLAQWLWLLCAPDTGHTLRWYLWPPHISSWGTYMCIIVPDEVCGPLPGDSVLLYWVLSLYCPLYDYLFCIDFHHAKVFPCIAIFTCQMLWCSALYLVLVCPWFHCVHQLLVYIFIGIWWASCKPLLSLVPRWCSHQKFWQIHFLLTDHHLWRPCLSWQWNHPSCFLTSS